MFDTMGGGGAPASATAGRVCGAAGAELELGMGSPAGGRWGRAEELADPHGARPA